MFAEGKKMKLIIDVRGLRLNELGFFPCPGLHMRKVLVCHAKSEVTTTPAAKQIAADICTPTTKPETPSEEADNLAQMTDLAQMASRRLQANEKTKGYAMECIAEDSSQ